MRHEYNKWTFWIGFMILFFLFMSSLTKANTTSYIGRCIYTDYKGLFAFKGGAGSDEGNVKHVDGSNGAVHSGQHFSLFTAVEKHVPKLVWMNDTAMPQYCCIDNRSIGSQIDDASVRKNVSGTAFDASKVKGYHSLANNKIYTGVCVTANVNIDHNQRIRPHLNAVQPDGRIFHFLFYSF